LLVCNEDTFSVKYLWSDFDDCIDVSPRKSDVHSGNSVDVSDVLYCTPCCSEFIGVPTALYKMYPPQRATDCIPDGMTSGSILYIGLCNQ